MLLLVKCLMSLYLYLRANFFFHSTASVSKLVSPKADNTCKISSSDFQRIFLIWSYKLKRCLIWWKDFVSFGFVTLCSLWMFTMIPGKKCVLFLMYSNEDFGFPRIPSIKYYWNEIYCKYLFSVPNGTVK